MSSHIIGPLTKKKVASSEKVTPSEQVEKGTKLLDDIDKTKFIETLDLPIRNYSLTPNKNKKLRDDLDDIETSKDS